MESRGKSTFNSQILPIFFSFLFVFTLAFIFMIDGVTDVQSENYALESKVDSLKTKYSNLTKSYDSLKTEYRKRDPRVIWLARAIYSETDRKHEMHYAAWVIRNRVELNFRGDSTYYDVVLRSNEFSAFNPGRGNRFYYATKPYSDIHNDEKETKYIWRDALEVARRVVFADSSKRPFSKYTLYFYSEVSMPSWKKHPEWRDNYERVEVASVDPKRFRFFADYDYKPSTDSLPIQINTNDNITVSR